MNTQSPDILGNPTIQLLGRHNQLQKEMRAGIAQQLLSAKKFAEMTPVERKVCVCYVVGESSSEAELCTKLGEIGVEYFNISWQDTNPEDQTSMEALALVKALGGMTSKTNSLVMVMILEDQF